MINRKCVSCAIEYTPKGNRQKYCKKCGPINHAEVNRQRAIEYYKKNKEIVLLKAKEYRAKPETIKSRRKKRLETKSHRSEYQKKWMLDNKHEVYAYNAIRRANRIKATPDWTATEDIASIYVCAEMAKIYTGKMIHVDHMVPLNGKGVCGLHCVDNLQLLYAEENQTKYNKLSSLGGIL